MFRRSSVFLAMLMLCALPDRAVAGQFSSSFASPPVAGVTLSGSASYTGGTVQLTPATNGQTGRMVIDDLDAAVAVDAFSAHMRIFIGGGTGADGMSINFGDPDSFTDFEEGVTSGLALSLDTFQNNVGDVAGRVEVKFNGASIASSAPLTLRTGSFVDFDVKMTSGGALTVHHNHTLAINAVAVAGWSGVAGRRFAIAARTGGSNDQHSVDNLVLATWSSASFRSDFDSPPVSGVSLFGSATYDAGSVKLTTNANSQIGSMVVADLDAGAPIQSFAARFRMLIGGGSGADGLSFNFGNVPDATFGEEGHGGLGLSISFDTHPQGGDTFADGIEAKWNDVTIASGSAPARTLETNTFLDVVVTVTAAGRLSVAHVNATNDSVALIDVAIPSWAPVAGWRFGLGGRTGGLNDNHWIDDLALETVACGNGMSEPGEECDSGALNGTTDSCCSATCTFQPSGTACTHDLNGCTDDECNGASAICQHPANSAPCNDGLFCNGTDTCGGGSCSLHAGDPCPGPDGDADCAESCDEGSDLCTAADNDGAACDDGTFCNGADTCAAGSCSLHAGDPCTGGGECADACNEAADHCNKASGTSCTDDGNECTDDECDGSGACVHPDNSAPCDDGQFCNGADTCAAGSCSLHAGDPCTGGGECADSCNEAADDCNDAAGVTCTDDLNVCTDDECDGAGACVHPDNSAPCDDGQFCNGADTCGAGSCSLHAGDPCTGGGECADSCNEAADDCNEPAGLACTDDLDACTDDECDGAGACGHPNNNAPCDDGDACTTPDVCSGGVCNGGAPPTCDDQSPCTEDTCDPDTGCVFTALPFDDSVCFTAAKASFQTKDDLDDTKDQIKWKRGDGEGYSQARLGNPATTATYTLCIYDTTAGVPTLAGSLTVAPSPIWDDQAPKGWKYIDKTGSQDGVKKLQLVAGIPEKAKMSLKAVGSTVSWPMPLGTTEFFDIDPSVIVQLSNDETGDCWTTTFDAAKKNDGARFKAKEP